MSHDHTIIMLLAETLQIMRIKPLKYDSDDELGAASSPPSPLSDKHGSSNDFEVEPLDVRNELPVLSAKLR